MPEVFGIEVDQVIDSQARLREFRKPPSRFVANKVIDHIDPLAQRFLKVASLAMLATRRTDGLVDVTPRGDPAGFAHVINERLIALPDRLGNNRADAFEGILEDPGIGLIFMIPGHNETLRISGRAKIVNDAKLLEQMDVRGHTPDLAILVRVERVLSHCPKAFVRAGAWSPEAWQDVSDVPSAGEFLVTHGKMPDAVVDVDAVVKKDGETRLY